MRSQRTLLAVCALALSALFVLWWSLARDGRTALGSDALAESAVAEPAAAPAAVEQREIAPEARAPAAESALDRGRAPESSPASAPDSAALDVLVLRSVTREPLAGAEVWFWGSAEAELDDERVVRALRAGRLERELAEHARRYVADEHGRARVERTHLHGQVVGVAPGWWGWGEVHEQSPSPLQVELARDFDLSARVVDDAGRPVEGASVALRSWGQDWSLNLRRATTGADGLALLRHAGTAFGDGFFGGVNVSLALDEALDPPVEAQLDPMAAPSEPVVLTLPASGSVEVVVLDRSGQPPAQPVEVMLAAFPLDADLASAREALESSEARAALRECAPDGRARFAHVSLGCALVVSAIRGRANVRHTTTARGPTSVGQQTTIELVLGAQVASLSGRLLDDRGQALAERRFSGRIESVRSGSTFESVLTQKTDVEGRFELDVMTNEGDDALQLVLQISDASGMELAAGVRALPLRLTPGVHDLGDIVLASSPLLAEGTVVDELGQPLQGATVNLLAQRALTPDPGSSILEVSPTLRAHTDAAGRFTLRGALKGDEFLLAASLGERSSDSRPAAPGVRDIVLVIGRTGALVGRVQLDESVPRSALYVEVSASFENGGSGFALLAEGGEFAVRGLRPGIYQFTLYDSNTWEVLATIGELAVRADQDTRDPRLDPLDLRGVLRSIRLVVLGEDAQPLPEANIACGASDSGELAQWYSFQGQALPILLSVPSVTLVVSAPGHLTQRLVGVRDDVTVSMQRGPSVRFVLGQKAALPRAPLALGVRIRSAGADEDAESWFEEEAQFGADGVARTTATAIGPVRFVLTLTKHDETTYSTVDLPDEPARSGVLRPRGEQVFQIDVDPALVAEYAKYLE